MKFILSHSNISSRQYSFKIIAFINAVFFSGYYVIKCPLAYVLQSEGMDQISSYSLSSTANIVFALCSLVFGIALKNFKTQKLALVIGVFFSTLSLMLLSTGITFLIKAAITFYILGGSLYFFSITLLVNKQFDATSERLKGNFLYQILVNFGGFIGELLFLLELNLNNSHHLFIYAIAICIFSLIILILNMKSIHDDKTSNKGIKQFFFTLFFLFGVIYFVLQYESMVRTLTVFLFIATVLYIFLKSRKHQNDRPLCQFIGLIILFSIPYWTSYIFMYNEFFDFLSKDVDTIWGFSGNTLLLLNPITNMLFGLLTITPLFSQRLSSYQYLNIGLFLIFGAFLLVTLSVKYSIHILNPIYPAIAIILYSIAEFLIQSTLNSSVSDLLKSSKSQVLGLGILRSSRSFAAAIAYYFMTYHGTNTLHYSASNEMQSAYYTYSLFSVAIGITFLLAISQAKKLLKATS